VFDSDVLESGKRPCALLTRERRLVRQIPREADVPGTHLLGGDAVQPLSDPARGGVETIRRSRILRGRRRSRERLATSGPHRSLRANLPSRRPSALPDRLRDQLQASLGASYTLERELGGGGMSHVFMAHDSPLAALRRSTPHSRVCARSDGSTRRSLRCIPARGRAGPSQSFRHRESRCHARGRGGDAKKRGAWRRTWRSPRRAARHRP